MSTIRFEETAHQRQAQLLTWTCLAVGLALTGVSLTTTVVSRHYRATERSEERQIAALAGQVALSRGGGTAAAKSRVVSAPGPGVWMMPASSPDAPAAARTQPRQSQPMSTGATGIAERPAVPASIPTVPRSLPVAASPTQLAVSAIRSNMAVRRVDLPDEGALEHPQAVATPTRELSGSLRSPVQVEKRSQAGSPGREKGAEGEARAKELRRQVASTSSASASNSPNNGGDAQLPASSSPDAPPARASVLTPPAVEAVSQSQAQVADLSSTGVRMKSGLTISIGGKFPSGEKLIAVDPAKHQIVTDQRTIVLMP